MPSNQTIFDFVRVARNLMPFTAYPYRGRETACPVCGSLSSGAVSGVDRRFKRLPTVVCETCGLLYTNPMPTEDELSEYYRKLYRLDYQFAQAEPSQRHIRKRSREAAGRVEAVADLLPPGAASLDFGTGSGEFVTAMCDRGFDAHGFDPGEAYATYAQGRLGARIVTATWQEMTHEAAFDLVTSFHVFEHLADPMAAFRAVARWVKPGGFVFIEVPDAIAQLEVKGFGSFHFAHVVGFNHHNLQLAAAQAGLTPARIVSPTSIVFRRAERPGDTVGLAQAGASLSAVTLAARSPLNAYVRYNLSKLAG